MNNKIVKILGIGCSVAGVGLSILTSIVAEKKLSNEITEKVAEAVKKAVENK